MSAKTPETAFTRLRKRAMTMETYVGLIIIVVIVITATIYIVRRFKESGL